MNLITKIWSIFFLNQVKKYKNTLSSVRQEGRPHSLESPNEKRASLYGLMPAGLSTVQWLVRTSSRSRLWLARSVSFDSLSSDWLLLASPSVTTVHRLAGKKKNKEKEKKLKTQKRQTMASKKSTDWLQKLKAKSFMNYKIYTLNLFFKAEDSLPKNWKQNQRLARNSYNRSKL